MGLPPLLNKAAPDFSGAVLFARIFSSNSCYNHKVRFSEAVLLITRHFTSDQLTLEDVHDTVAWETRDIDIRTKDGHILCAQKDVLVPETWSTTATNIVVGKYFSGHVGEPKRETSVWDMLLRIVAAITNEGQQKHYFDSLEEGQSFACELCYLLLHQKATFNSPVWFNVGIEEKPQTAACFLLGIEDDMSSILDHSKTAGIIYKRGSGAGVNYSNLRELGARLSNGGLASGPVSFLRGHDSMAGTIKSGGRARRAATMAVLNIDHPDIVEFIACKVWAEKAAHALIAAGFSTDFDDPNGAYAFIPHQNTNHSVRLSDKFMEAVKADKEWVLQTREGNGEVLSAKMLFERLATAAWFCGDPGVQFSDTINRWHTCPWAGPIETSNPCGEVVFLNNSACNLATLNVCGFFEGQDFRGVSFAMAARIMLIAQDILVDLSSYPTPQIADNSHKFRPLGLGFTNLAAALIHMGLPYDSDAGRLFAGLIAALLQGSALNTSQCLARQLCPFEGDSEKYLDVVRRQAEQLPQLLELGFFQGRADLTLDIKTLWASVATEAGQGVGFRNAQVTNLAPYGTTSFMLDCDTTSIEPLVGLIVHKHQVGGEIVKLIPKVVGEYLKERFGRRAKQIWEHLEQGGHLGDAPFLEESDLAALKTAFGDPEHCISTKAHLEMMAAVQPFLSGAISKTVNLPERATIQDVADVFLTAWRLGLKSVTIYRDGCKKSQPLTVGALAQTIQHKRLPGERESLTKKFRIGPHTGYFTWGFYGKERQPKDFGELFIVMAKQGSLANGLLNAFATAVSLGLQHGVPLGKFIRKFSHLRFEPSGYTGEKSVPFTKSILDFIFRWTAKHFLEESLEEQNTLGQPMFSLSGNLCPQCGHPTNPQGCHPCPNCGADGGCG